MFIQQPTSTVVGATIIPAITVQLKDSFGNSVATPGVSVTITINSGGGSLGGTATRLTDASGLATFNNLNINTSGTKTLKAASGTLTPEPGTDSREPVIRKDPDRGQHTFSFLPGIRATMEPDQASRSVA